MVSSGLKRRRRWTDEERLRIVAAGFVDETVYPPVISIASATPNNSRRDCAERAAAITEADILPCAQASVTRDTSGRHSNI